MICISGNILTKDSFERGYVIIDDIGMIKEFGRIPSKRPDVKGCILPKPINAHTHIGDSFIREKIKDLPRDIEKLVAPPYGLKHVMLEKASDEEILRGMKISLEEMKNTGTSLFCDFREGGLMGVELLKKALMDFSIRSLIMSRPKEMKFDEDEIKELLRISDGIGISSINDWNYEYLREISKLVKRERKMLSMHASERIREDIEKIMDLKPDFLIHMNKASRDDLEIVADMDIPVVICPRSNEFFGLKPKVEEMFDLEIRISLGTDNAMISNPNIFEEVRWVRMNFKSIPMEEVLRMVTYNPREMLYLEPPEFEEERFADIVVLDTKSLKPIFISGSEVS